MEGDPGRGYCPYLQGQYHGVGTPVDSSSDKDIWPSTASRLAALKFKLKRIGSEHFPPLRP